ncbi:MAG: hypothetical protein NC902_08505, partial [Candidatus Omnitrophica bacterium]|nr:hypothetical protein [Candidatus Omnitrophota bacterium]
MKITGFTLTEIATVAAIVSSLSVGGYHLVKKGQDSVCINNLKQIGQAIAMFEADHGDFPVAAFYPRDAADPRGIHNLLKKYGATAQLFFCPSISSDFNKYGTNYLWNEAVRNNRPSDLSRLWLMTEITSLYPELPTPHTGGYGILYADGHAAIARDFSFPKFERPALASNISTEKQKEESSEQKKEETQEEKSVSRFGSYSIVNISPVVQAGKPVTIAIKAVDVQGKIYDSNEKLRILDFTQTVEPSEVVLQNGIANTMVIFKKSHSSNVLTAIDSKGRWSSSNEFVVEPAQAASIEIIPPDIVYAGDVASFRVVLRDVYGNVISKEGIGISTFVGTQADYPVDVISDATGQIVVPVMFRKAGEAKISFSVKGTVVKESCSIKVRPGPVDRFEISEIKSPVEAGKVISITIKALDKYGNRTKGFMFSTDKKIPVYVQEDMSSGIWMETIKFEKAVSETFIEVSDGMGHTGKSNLFSVVPSYPVEIKL